MNNTTTEGSKFYLYSITAVAILGGLLFGYDTAVVSGGLAIVKHIVQYYKGTIHLESELGKGTTFKIVLPINKDSL